MRGALSNTAPSRPETARFATRRGRVLFTRRFSTATEIVGPVVLRLAVEVRGCRDVFLFAGIRKLRRGRWFYPRNPLTGQFPAFFEKSPRGRCAVHSGSGIVSYLEVPIHRCGSGRRP